MKKSLVFALSFLGTVGFATATPAVTLGLLGRYLDRHFGTSPKIFIALMLIALGLSLVILARLAKRASEGLKNINNK